MQKIRKLLALALALMLPLGFSACDIERLNDEIDKDIISDLVDGLDPGDFTPTTDPTVIDGGDDSDDENDSDSDDTSDDDTSDDIDDDEDTDENDDSDDTDSDDSGNNPAPNTDFKLGTAGSLSGKTIIVSVFSSDSQYSWDFSSSKDKQTISNISTYLGIATKYLTQVASKYGKEAEFVYNTDQNSDLTYTARFDGNLQDINYIDSNFAPYIDKNISTTKLMQKYNADNVIYMAFMNTDSNSSAVSCTRNWYSGIRYPYEIVYMYNIDYGQVASPSVYAHELLHAFGAPDLYMEDTEYNITTNFVNYVKQNLPNEIMYTNVDPNTGGYVYDKISNEVSQLTAYYVGLTSSSDLVAKHGLGKSQHFS